MSVLVDTNIVTRLAQPNHPHHISALTALDQLKARGVGPCIAAQNLYEFWVVCTRPTNQNGFGFTPSLAQAELQRIHTLFPILPETPAVYPEWERLVARYDVKGKNAHDTHLVATMLVNNVNEILTFNVADFARYSEISALTPLNVISGKNP